MTLALKVDPGRLTDGMAEVPRMKSAVLSSDDIGQTVYVWFGDSALGKGALHAEMVLRAYEEVKLPQVRDPSKRKDAYRLTLAPISAQVTLPLTTDDLGPYRYVEGADGIESLGRIHRDRNDKIIRLTSAEAEVLRERFQH